MNNSNPQHHEQLSVGLDPPQRPRCSNKHLGWPQGQVPSTNSKQNSQPHKVRLPKKCKMPNLQEMRGTERPTDSQPKPKLRKVAMPSNHPDQLEPPQQERWRPQEADLHLEHMASSSQGDSSRWRLNPKNPAMLQQMMALMSQAANMSGAVKTNVERDGVSATKLD